MAMKKRLLLLLLAAGSLSLTGCNFFTIIGSSTESYSETPWSGEKQKLTYTQTNLTPVHYQDVDTMPTTGKPKLLVLPILFRDSSDFLNNEEKEAVLTNVDKMAFGTSEDTGWHSISTYYREESHGACEIEGEVAPWYTTSYGYDQITSTKVVDIIISSAVKTWKEANPEKVKEYDTDGNGFLDGVLAIYGGPNYTNKAKLNGHRPNENMWAFTSWLDTSANTNNPSPKTYIWASYDFMENDNSHDLLIDGHTYIHEMGHVFGLDDYYDYAKKGLWAGAFSMQDYNVGGHDPYSMLALGWADPYVPTSSATITIKPFESSGDMILLSPDFSSNSAFDEYILLEYYSPTGVNERDSKYQYEGTYPLGPNERGIRIWHVDARLLKIVTKRDSRTGREKDVYTITNTIDPSEGSYIVGCTNTTKTGGDSDSYISIAAELQNYKLLQLIRKGDYSASKTDDALSNNYLFKSNETFSLSQYSGYFRNTTRLNNGSRFNWSVTVNSISRDEATITVKI